VGGVEVSEVEQPVGVGVADQSKRASAARATAAA
jgi:hypothetical protein